MDSKIHVECAPGQVSAVEFTPTFEVVKEHIVTPLTLGAPTLIGGAKARHLVAADNALNQKLAASDFCAGLRGQCSW